MDIKSGLFYVAVQSMSCLFIPIDRLAFIHVISANSSWNFVMGITFFLLFGMQRRFLLQVC